MIQNNLREDVDRVSDLRNFVYGVSDIGKDTELALTGLFALIKSLHPSARAWLRVLELVFALHLIICISCLAILFLQPRGKLNGLWVFKKLYITDSEGQKVSSTPLYLPNSGMTMAISQFIASISTQVYVWALHRAFQSPNHIDKAQMITCIGFMYTFEFFAYWIMSWSLVYTRLCSETNYIAKLKAHSLCAIPPLFYNIFFISFPVIIAICHLYITYSVVTTLILHSKTWLGFVNALHSGSLIWEQFNTSQRQKSHADMLSKILDVNQRIENLGLEIVIISSHMISKFKFAWIFWASVMFVTFMILASSLSRLFFSIRTKIFNRGASITENSTVSINLTPLSRSKLSAGGTSDKNYSNIEVEVQGTRNHRSSALKKRLNHLSIRGGVMLFSILLTIANVIIGATQAEKMATKVPLKSLMDWLPLISGSAAALPITFQCWRIFQDEDLIFVAIK
ncbi:expressed protein [Phakopsora pachyrhizi]|uniref:Expressed protein n=1 Tax=Phakopsora pachyrhizi TaxID=170000 RepID=A0AAV0BJE0_PHAPC|nr:expressed protein [Phakopsora pachyrhizi]